MRSGIVVFAAVLLLTALAFHWGRVPPREALRPPSGAGASKSVDWPATPTRLRGRLERMDGHARLEIDRPAGTAWRTTHTMDLDSREFSVATTPGRHLVRIIRDADATTTVFTRRIVVIPQGKTIDLGTIREGRGATISFRFRPPLRTTYDLVASSRDTDAAIGTPLRFSKELRRTARHTFIGLPSTRYFIECRPRIAGKTTYPIEDVDLTIGARRDVILEGKPGRRPLPANVRPLFVPAPPGLDEEEAVGLVLLRDGDVVHSVSRVDVDPVRPTPLDVEPDLRIRLPIPRRFGPDTEFIVTAHGHEMRGVLGDARGEDLPPRWTPTARKIEILLNWKTARSASLSLWAPGGDRAAQILWQYLTRDRRSAVFGSVPSGLDLVLEIETNEEGSGESRTRRISLNGRNQLSIDL